MEDAEKMFEKDPGLLSDIVSAMPKRVEALRDGFEGKEETINVNQEETEMYSYLILFISVVQSIFTYLTNHPGQCARLVGPFQERRHEP